MDERTLTRVSEKKDEGAGWHLSAGETVGAFRVLRPLGRGGMGEVYEVEQIHLLKRYALKVLTTENAAFVARFRQEARVMADMRHPNLVSVHHFDVDEVRGFCYFVMDFVIGPEHDETARSAPRVLPTGDPWLGDACSLADLVPLPGHRLNEGEVRRLAVEVCDALQYAHGFGGGVLHRDLKPSNILINASRHALVSDFGVAKIIGLGCEQALLNTEVWSCTGRWGTSEYMAPEQRAGKSVSPRSDLYAVGVILYRLLVGYLPVGRWLPPSKCGVGCARGWDRIVCRCLAVDPDARYPDAEALRKALLALHLAAPGDMRKPWRWAAAAGGAAAVLGAVVFIIGTFGPGKSAGHDRNLTSVSQSEARKVWRVVCTNAKTGAKKAAACAVDGDPQTAWRQRIADQKAALDLDLASIRIIGGVTCRMPAAGQLGADEGSPVAVEAAVSRDGVFWAVADGALSPALEGMDGQFRFEHPLSGRYVRIRALASARGSTAVVPELGFLLADGKAVRLHL